MKLILHCALLVFYIAVTYSSLYTNLKNDVLGYLNRPVSRTKESLRTGEEIGLGLLRGPKHTESGNNDENELEKPEPQQSVPKKRFRWEKERYDVATRKPEYLAKLRSNQKADGESELSYQKRHLEDLKDVENAQNKVKILQKAKNIENKLNNVNNLRDVPSVKSGDVDKQIFHMDPVLNLLRSRNLRRSRKDTSADTSSSSSREMKEWKDEWAEHWMKKKFEALNSSAPRGDIVNMVAARPWGVPCGDPNQHDMPWGSCMLPHECESEYRIYRGDSFCGRSEFVCCAIQLTNYDLYQGFDVSFEDKSLSTDTEERKDRGLGSREKKRKNRDKQKRKRQRDRNKRKRKIRRNIRKIIREMRKILNRAYRNGTSKRKKKTKKLKKFIRHLKRKYKRDRMSVKEIHGEQMIQIDAALQQKLYQIKALNQQFMKNETLRDIIVNGTISKKGARILVDAYPELESYLRMRRSMSGPQGLESKEPDNLEYDIEYGLLYY